MKIMTTLTMGLTFGLMQSSSLAQTTETGWEKCTIVQSSIMFLGPQGAQLVRDVSPRNYKRQLFTCSEILQQPNLSRYSRCHSASADAYVLKLYDLAVFPLGAGVSDPSDSIDFFSFFGGLATYEYNEEGYSKYGWSIGPSAAPEYDFEHGYGIGISRCN